MASERVNEIGVGRNLDGSIRLMFGRIEVSLPPQDAVTFAQAILDKVAAIRAEKQAKIIVRHDGIR